MRPCANGGVCLNNFTGFTCQCVDGWQGETCDYRSTDFKRCVGLFLSPLSLISNIFIGNDKIPQLSIFACTIHLAARK